MTTAADILNPAPNQPAPPESGTPPPDPNAVANPPPAGWWDGVKDPELKSFLANKAYDSPETLGKAYRSLEQLLGADKAGRAVVLPKDDNDVEGRKAFLSKIGVPDTADGYKLPVPEGDDGAFAKVAASAFHEAGVPAKAAEAFVAKINAFIAEQVTAEKTASAQRVEAELATLKGEWGAEYDAKADVARRGMAEVGAKAGFDKPMLERMEAAIGTAATLKLFSTLGSYVGEAKFAGGGGANNQFGMSVQQAQARLSEITAARAEGKISDHQYRTEIEPEIDQLMKVLVTRAA